jgi:hypothetical protein
MLDMESLELLRMGIIFESMGFFVFLGLFFKGIS